MKKFLTVLMTGSLLAITLAGCQAKDEVQSYLTEKKEGVSEAVNSITSDGLVHAPENIGETLKGALPEEFMSNVAVKSSVLTVWYGEPDETHTYITEDGSTIKKYGWLSEDSDKINLWYLINEKDEVIAVEYTFK